MNIGGRWNDQEENRHINFLELLAISHAITSFCKTKSDIHVQVRSDNTTAISCISCKWTGTYMYAFPPFSVIGRLVQKVRFDIAEMVLVAPVLVTQNWYTAVLEMLVDDLLIVKVREDTLTLPGLNQIHPLVNRLLLMVCHISGDPTKAEIYRSNLSKSLWRPKDDPLRSNILPTSKNVFSSVVKGRVISFIPL